MLEPLRSDPRYQVSCAEWASPIDSADTSPIPSTELRSCRALWFQTLLVAAFQLR